MAALVALTSWRKGEKRNLGAVPRAGSRNRRLPFPLEMYPATASESSPQNPNPFPASTWIYVFNIFSKLFLGGNHLFGCILIEIFALSQPPSV